MLHEAGEDRGRAPTIEVQSRIGHVRVENMRTIVFFLALLSMTVWGSEFSSQEGWESLDSPRSYESLLKSVKNATEASELNVVTEAGPTVAAKKRGVNIPGNCVIGIFNNDVAVRVLKLSEAAMIEAPMRMYVTENEDGTANLSWKRPSFILSPYLEEGGEELAAIGAELDAVFEAIGKSAVKPD